MQKPNTVAELRAAVKKAEDDFLRINNHLPEFLYLGVTEFNIALRGDFSGWSPRDSMDAPMKYLGIDVLPVFCFIDSRKN